MITMVHVFGITFEFYTAPSFVQYRARLAARRYGTNLDSRAPRALRLALYRLLVKFGTPGTPV